MTDFIPILILAIVFIITYYLKKINLKFFIIVYATAILIVLGSAYLYIENRNINILFPILGIAFLIKRINKKH